MKTNIAFLGLVGVALAGCGGGGDEGEFVISDGVLTGVELPSAAELAEYPPEIQMLINDFQDRNENTAPPTNVPTSGTANYTGVLGFSVENDDEVLAIITGDLDMTADWDNPFGDLVTGTVSNLSGEDGDGNALTLSNTLAIDAPITGSTMNGSISGNVVLEGETYGVNGGFDGSFAGDGATSALGETQGTIFNPDASTDDFSGLWFADN